MLIITELHIMVNLLLSVSRHTISMDVHCLKKLRRRLIRWVLYQRKRVNLNKNLLMLDLLKML